MSDSTLKKRKAFGIGLGKKETKEPAATNDVVEDKWLAGISSQLSEVDNEEIDVRAIPLRLILLDPTNPRELDLDIADIVSNIEVLKLPPEALIDDNDEWVEEYQAKVIGLFGNTKKSHDLMSVAIFAADIKHPKNLINPISVWRDETSFYLFAGERRLLAHFLLEANQIFGRVWEAKPDHFDLKILQWQENNLRENLSLHEKLKNIRQIIEEWSLKFPGQKLTVRKFSRLVSMKRSQAACYLRVAKAEYPPLLAAIKDGDLSTIDLASELVTLDKDALDQCLDKLKAGEVITKEMIHQETASTETVESIKIGNQDKKPKRQFALRLNKKANQKPVSFIVTTLVEKINSDDLTAAINEYDLSEANDLSKALNVLLEYLEEQGTK